MTDAPEIRTPLRFVVTVDTEADDAWSRPQNVAVTNIAELDRFQDLCERYAVVPTYLLAYECATRDEALKTLKPIAEHRSCEIGHHLHVWTTPPFQKEGPAGVDVDWVHSYQFELPDSLFTEKAECLRNQIEKNFGRSPTSHRAGRWGIDQRTVDWLARSGFVAETSMRTGLRLRDPGPDATTADPRFRAIASTRYEWHRNPYVWPGDAGDQSPEPIIEIPATVDVPNGAATSLLLKCLNLKWPGEFLLFRVFRKLAGLSMLCPDPNLPADTLPRIIERAVQRGATVINLAFHSSELALHCSPFTTTREDRDRVWRHLEEAFRYCRDRGIISQGISDVARLTRDQATPAV